MYSESQRRTIAGRARTLHERLAGPPNEPGEPPIDPEEIRAAWREQFPDETAFHERLAADDLAGAPVDEQLAATRWPAHVDLPEWIDELESLTRRLCDGSVPSVPAPESVPFAEVVEAVVAHARAGLDGDAAALVEGFEGPATLLIERLRAVCLRPLYVEFGSFVEHHDPALAATDPDEVEEPPTALYEAFVDALFEGALADLWLEYPVLARLVVRTVGSWRSTVAELATRLDRDEAILRERFGVEGSLTAVEPLATDTHADGRVPFRAAFESGAVVYKPRSVGGESLLYRASERVVDRAGLGPIDPPATLERDGYGWVEHVAHENPPDETALDRYYRLAGATVCVAYALRVTDCQFENVVADGRRPVVVDGETALHPPPRPTATPTDASIVALFGNSVLGTALLPVETADPTAADGAETPASLAGLGRTSDPTPETAVTRPTVAAVNTDLMRVEQTRPSVDAATNTPTVDGRDRPPSAHVDAVVDGFERAYEAITNVVDSGAPESGLLPDDGDDHRGRFVFRPTVRYAAVRRAMVGRDPLRDGARLTVELEALAAPFFGDEIEDDRHWPLYAAERRALRRFDVPRFELRPEDARVRHDGEPTGATADVAGLDRVRDRLDALGPSDRRRQVRLIEASLRRVDDTSVPTPSERFEDGSARHTRDTADGDWRVETAAARLDEAIGEALSVGDRDAWVSLAGSRRAPELRVTPATASLYDGTAGIAVAAAGLYDATGRRDHRRRARRLAGRLASELDGRAFEPGGYRGTASILYGLAVCAELLESDPASEVDVGRLVPPSAVETVEETDIIFGLAGTALGLAAWDERRGDPVARKRAVACGERLLAAATPADAGRRWEDLDAGTTRGFAHGTAGVGYALARLAALVGDDAYAAAARDALAFELDHPDRPDAGMAHRHRWCHGRTGVGLAQVGVGRCLGDDATVEAGVETLLGVDGAGPLDNLCCGALGRIDALLAAATLGGDERAAVAARRLGRRRLRDRTASLRLPGHFPPVVNPVLFDGTAGAAYAALRLADPSGVPSVCLLE